MLTQLKGGQSKLLQFLKRKDPPIDDGEDRDAAAPKREPRDGIASNTNPSTHHPSHLTEGCKLG
jgi:hypothetical protein